MAGSTASGDAALILALNEGVFDRPLWDGFLKKLRDQTGALHANLSFRTADNAIVGTLWAGTPLPPEAAALLEERFDGDPLPHRRIREGRVYTLPEMIDPHDQSHAAFYRDILDPIGLRYHRIVRVTEPSGIDAWLTVGDGRDFRASTSALLSRLVPHLRHALRTFVALERERMRSSISSEAIGRLNFGWVALDAQCRIIDTTPNMDRIFGRSALMRRDRYGRLAFAAGSIDREVGAIVRRFADDQEGQARAFHLSQDPWMDILVAPAKGRLILPEAASAAIVYVSGDHSSRRDRRDQLVELFGLLPSEARLAWAIAQGHSIAEAAQELGLTLETARNYTKKIYSKTGARGQADLVRIVLTGVLAIV